MSRPFTETLTEGQALAAKFPTTINSTSIVTLGLNMAEIRRARAILKLGTGAGAVTFTLQSSATATGVYADITNQATTNPSLTGLLTGTYNTIEIRADQMPTGQPFLRAKALETGGSDIIADLTLIGDCVAYGPGNQFNNITLGNAVVCA